MGGVYSARLCPEFLQQRLGLLQVGGVESLGEPAIDWRQQPTGLGALALLLPQTSEAHGRSQLPRLGLLATGHSEGLLEAGFRLLLVMRSLFQQQLPLEAIEFRFRPAFLRCSLVCECLC